MKHKYKLFFKTVAISAACCILFIAIGYFYLDLKLNKPAKTEVKDVPYSYTPQNKGLLFDISGSKTLIYLNFEEKSVAVVMSGFSSEQESVYGYPIDYTVATDYNLLGGIIDTVGGIELEIGEEDLIYTGIQVVDFLTTTPESNKLRREIIEKILYKIAQNGFLRQDFIYIIENSNTNLTVPDCYFWQDSISELCKTVRILE